MVNLLLGALVDPLTAAALNTAVWNANTGTVALVAPGRVSVAATSAGSALAATGPYEATGQTIYARVTPALAGTGGQVVQTTMAVQLNTNNQAYLLCKPGTVWQAVVVNAGTATTVNLPAFDPAAHAWWQIAEASGQFLFSVSGDGAAWTQVAAIAYTWSPHAVSVSFGAQSTAVSGQLAYVEHVNTAAGTGGLMPSWPRVRFQVAFNTGGSSTTLPSFVDLSSRLRGSWSAELAGRQYELDQVQSGQMTVSLANLDGALDPTNTASPYYPHVVPMRQVRMQAVWPPTRNLLPQNVSSATTAANVGTNIGTFGGVVTGLAPAPTGHTAAFAWSLSASTTAANVMGLVAANNNGAGWLVSDGSALPVVAGQSYTFSCWVAQAAGGDAALQAAHRISWYDVTGARITASVGGSVTVPILGTSWALLTYTVTAPSGSVGCRPGVENFTSPSVGITLYVTAWQMEQSAAATPWTAGGVIYPIWAGFVERWPQSWSMQGTYGLVSLTCIDVLAGLSQFTLQPSFQQQLQALGPTMLYPLNEAAGNLQFADATGQRSVRFAWAAPGGGAGASISAGSSVQGSGFIGATGPVTTINNPTPGSATPSQAIYISAPWAGPFGPPATGGWTRLICFRTTVTPSNRLALWSAISPVAGGTGGGSQAFLELWIDSSGHFTAEVNNTAGTATATVGVPDVLCTDGNWHIGIVQLSADGTLFTVACDQFGYEATTTGDYHPTGCTSDSVGAVILNGNAYNCYSGDVAFITEYAYAIGNSAAFDLGTGISTGWAGETSAARAQRILTMAGYGGTITTRSAATAMGGANLAGTDAMSALQLVGDTEAGQIYADGAGALWLTGRAWRYMQASPAVTFGEQQANGEVPYLGSVAVDFDPTHIYNAAEITNVVAPGFPEQAVATAPNPTSQAAYLPRTLTRSINVQDTTQPAIAAQYLVQQYGQPQARLSALTVDGASNPALWATILGLGFGTRAQVNRRPPTAPGAPEISVQQFVEHLTWTGDDQGSLTLALQLTPAGPYIGWGIVAPLHTTLASAATAGTNTVTLGPLPGSAGNTAASALPAGTVLTVGYGTAAAENVTVLSVGATTAGYTSVVVTLTANLASNHASGVTVCQPVPAGVVLPSTVSYPTGLDAGATLASTGGPRAAY